MAKVPVFLGGRDMFLVEEGEAVMDFPIMCDFVPGALADCHEIEPAATRRFQRGHIKAFAIAAPRRGSVRAYVEPGEEERATKWVMVELKELLRRAGR